MSDLTGAAIARLREAHCGERGYVRCFANRPKSGLGETIMLALGRDRCGKPDSSACLLNQLASLADESQAPTECLLCGKKATELEAELLSFGTYLKTNSNDMERHTACLQLIEREARESGTGSASPVPTMIGTYEIKEQLGVGGMGTVYRATHLKLRKDVAIKLLPPRSATSDEAIARFEREMEAIGHLDHSNIVRAMDAGEEGGTSFLVMELVRGWDLGQIVDRGRRLNVPDACEIIRQTAIGLQYAHDQGLIHRDVKPANLMLTKNSAGDPIVKVTDLGLALLNEGRSSPQLTGPGQLMGTLEFMAPEQAGDYALDSRADIYALGATLFRLLSGTVPFDGPEYNTPVKRLNGLSIGQARSIAERRGDLPIELVALVDKMLARSPEDRPGTMQAVVDALTPFAAGHQLSELCEKSAGILRKEQRDSMHVVLADTSPTTGLTLRSRNSTGAAKDVSLSKISSDNSDGTLEKITGQTLLWPRHRWWLAAAALSLTALLVGVIWLQMIAPPAMGTVGPLDAGGLSDRAPDSQIMDQDSFGDRKLATWVLANGGGFTPTGGQLIRGIRAELPTTDFQVGAVEIYEADESDIEQLASYVSAARSCRNVFIEADRSTPLGRESLAAMGRVHHLENLSLKNGDVPDDGWDDLKALRELKVLDLTSVLVTEEGLHRIQQNHPKLETLGLHVESIEEDTLSALADMTSLKHLSIALPRLSLRLAEQIVASPAINLTLRAIPRINDEALGAIARSSRITRLSVSDGDFDDEALRMLEASSSLKSLDLSGVSVSEAAEASFGERRPNTKLTVTRR